MWDPIDGNIMTVRKFIELNSKLYYYHFKFHRPRFVSFKTFKLFSVWRPVCNTVWYALFMKTSKFKTWSLSFLISRLIKYFHDVEELNHELGSRYISRFAPDVGFPAVAEPPLTLAASVVLVALFVEEYPRTLASQFIFLFSVLLQVGSFLPTSLQTLPGAEGVFKACGSVGN